MNVAWQRIYRRENDAGEVTIEYAPEGSIHTFKDLDVRIQSRKRAIPHANGSGVWFHTSYFVIVIGKYETEFWSLREAKAAAERIIFAEERA